MLFNSFIFLFAFLPIAYVVFWALRDATTRYVWLTLTGYVFYGYWDARFCLLMAFRCSEEIYSLSSDQDR
jgi:D-alanyl-lipoteichoic acid acyltransferase DltB (MBOAT superfamily)